MWRDLRPVLESHREWFTSRFNETPQPEHYLFPWGTPSPTDPTRCIGDIKKAWLNLKKRSGVRCRFHDLRHAAATKRSACSRLKVLLAPVAVRSPDDGFSMGLGDCNCGGSCGAHTFTGVWSGGGASRDSMRANALCSGLLLTTGRTFNVLSCFTSDSTELFRRRLSRSA